MLSEILRRFKNDVAAASHYAAEAKAARRRRVELKAATLPEYAVERELPDSAPATSGTTAPPAVRLDGDPAPLEGVPDEDVITVVSGLPRSGASLMMQLLVSAGLPVFTDGERQADPSNQRGYYEHRRVTTLRSQAGQSLSRGCGGEGLEGRGAPALEALPLRGFKEGGE